MRQELHAKRRAFPHKNRLNCSGIRSSLCSSPFPSVTLASPGLSQNLHHHLIADGKTAIVWVRSNRRAGGVAFEVSGLPIGDGA